MIDLDSFGITLEQYLAHSVEYEALGEQMDAMSDLPRREKVHRYVCLFDEMSRIVPSPRSQLPLGSWRVLFRDANAEQLATALIHLDDGPMKDAVRAKLAERAA